MIRFAIVVFVIIIGCSADDNKETIGEGRDSYIDAYVASRGGSDKKQNSNDRTSKYSPYYDSGPEQQYGSPSGPPQGYGGPDNHHPQTGQYGPPTGPYGPPSGHYGPPSPVYGPPIHVPSFPVSAPFYGMPHAMLGFLDKLHLKLDIFTILKILLKLVIFKKIVSFIALICLLLFIPKFKMDNPMSNAQDAEDSDARAISDSKYQVDARINTITRIVFDAIEKYSQENNTTCDNCDAQNIFRDLDRKFSYERLLGMYSVEDS